MSSDIDLPVYTTQHPEVLEYSNIILYVQKKKIIRLAGVQRDCSYKNLSEVSEPESKMWERVYAPD